MVCRLRLASNNKLIYTYIYIPHKSNENRAKKMVAKGKIAVTKIKKEIFLLMGCLVT